MDAVAVVVVAHQLLAVEGDGGEAVDVETFVFGNEDVPFSGRSKSGSLSCRRMEENTGWKCRPLPS